MLFLVVCRQEELGARAVWTLMRMPCDLVWLRPKLLPALRLRHLQDGVRHVWNQHAQRILRRFLLMVLQLCEQT